MTPIHILPLRRPTATVGMQTLPGTVPNDLIHKYNVVTPALPGPFLFWVRVKRRVPYSHLLARSIPPGVRRFQQQMKKAFTRASTPALSLVVQPSAANNVSCLAKEITGLVLFMKCMGCLQLCMTCITRCLRKRNPRAPPGVAPKVKQWKNKNGRGKKSSLQQLKLPHGRGTPSQPAMLMRTNGENA